MIQVQIEGRETLEFPDETPDHVIDMVVQRDFFPKKKESLLRSFAEAQAEPKPMGITKEQLFQLGRETSGVPKGIQGFTEGLGTTAIGLLGLPVAGIAGLGAGLGGIGTEGRRGFQGFLESAHEGMEEIQKKLPQPQTPEGEKWARRIQYPIEVLSKISSKAGELVARVTDEPDAGAVVETILMMGIPSVVGKTTKFLRKGKVSPAEAKAFVTEIKQIAYQPKTTIEKTGVEITPPEIPSPITPTLESIQAKKMAGHPLSEPEIAFLSQVPFEKSKALVEVKEQQAKMTKEGMTMKPIEVVNDLSIKQIAEAQIKGDKAKVQEAMNSLNAGVNPQEVAHNVQTYANKLRAQKAIERAQTLYKMGKISKAELEAIKKEGIPPEVTKALEPIESLKAEPPQKAGYDPEPSEAIIKPSQPQLGLQAETPALEGKLPSVEAPETLLGRAVEEIALEPVSPEAGGLAFGQPLPKYRGSINLERIEAPYEIKKLVNDLADQYNIKKTKRTWAEIQEEANSLGIDIDSALKDKPAHISGEAWIQAKRDLVNDAVTKLSALQKKHVEILSRGEPLTDMATVDIRLAMNKVAGILKSVHNEAGEAGRILNIHKKMSQAKGTVEGYKTVLDALGDKELTTEIVERFLKLDPNNPLAVQTFIKTITHTPFKDKAYFAVINGWLSNPASHIANILGNTATFLLKGLEIPPKQTFYHYKGGLQALTANAKAVKSGYNIHQSVSKWQGIKEGVRAGLKAIEDQMPADILLQSKIEGVQLQAIGGKTGAVIGAPTKALRFEDNIFKAVNYRAALYSEAYKLSKGDKVRMGQLMENPTPEMLKKASQEALYRTFNNPSRLASWLIQGRKLPIVGTPLAYIIPFVRTPVNIAKFALERTPLGLLFYKTQSVPFKTALARSMTGTLTAMAVMEIVSEGKITGGGPKQKEAKDALYRVGWQPYSFEINGKYYSYNRLEPLGMILGMSADLAEITQNTHGKPDRGINDIAAQIALSFSKNLSSKTFLIGVTSMLDAITEPERYGEAWVGRFIGSAIPAGIAGVSRVIDPALRQRETPLDVLRARTPFLSEGLLPKRDIWGEEIKRESAGFISPIAVSTLKKDKLNLEMVRLRVTRGLPSKEIKGIKLSPQNYDLYAVTSGQLAKNILSSAVNSPAWNTLSDTIKKKIIEDTIDDAREMGRLKVLIEITRRQGK